MNFRVGPAALAFAICLSSLFVAAPATAVPAAPGIGSLDTSTVGHVSGTVSSATPYVLVAVVATSDTTEPERSVVTMGSSSSFNLPTWGYGSTAAVRAWACPTSNYDPTGCSAPTTKVFTPTDLVPQVTWFSDAYIGPNDPNPTITVADPGGGGVLKASFVHGYGLEVLDTVVTPGVATNVIGDLDRTSGYVQLSRCSGPDLVHCATFEPDLQKSVWVVRNITIRVLGSIPPMTSVADTHFSLNAEFDGTAVVSWHLESAAEPGTPIAGTEHTANRAVDLDGNMARFDVPRVNVPDGSYTVVGTLTLNGSTYYGSFPASGFTAPLIVDQTGPGVAITANHTKIWPFLPSLYPASVTWSITGDVDDISKLSVRSAAGNLVTNPTLHKTSATTATAAWNGKWPDGSAKDSSYTLVATDSRKNPTSSAKVVVDNTKLVLKTFTKTITAGGSMKDQYVGRCSTLRKPSLRGWTYSLGLYANTKCSSQTSKDSVINTIHAVKLPKAYSYVDVKVSTYGGAATAKPQSPAVLEYLTVNGDFVSRQRLSSTLGNHPGEVRSARNMIFSDLYFAWSVYTGFGYRYDLKSFTVVVHYKVFV